TLMATRIKIEDRFEAEIEITGVIQSKGENTLRVADFDFQVTAETEIVDDEDNPIGFEDLDVGAVVEIRAVRTADDQLIATRIKLENVFQDEVELTGNIDSIDGQTVVVAGIAFVVDANTEILDKEENPVAFSVLTVGLLIEVSGIVQSNGDILATRIKIQDRIEDEVEVVGVIEQVDASAITVLGRTFGITQNTIVTDENENIIDLSRLFIGQTVKIRGDLLPDGTLIAIVIRQENQQAQEIEVVGPVDTKTDNTMEVVGIHFFVTDTTEFLDERGSPITFTGLEVGKTVEVRAVGQPNGTRVATQVKIQDVLLLTGTIQQVVLNGISVVGKQVLFDSNTLILGKLNGFLTHDDLKVGQFVEIRAQQGNDNILFATKVKVQDRVTSVAPAGTLSGPTPPESFVLLQNYPNPFNPTTTITFDIPESAGGIVNTKVTVFNVLGQTVRTLVDAPMAPGRHRVRWDGRDGSGRAMPTGVYFYRLKAGKITKTNRMLLLK
ncbi:MAG: T9SS C-terminal target domain-containing protein, partial [Calditrichaeota bacterium]